MPTPETEAPAPPQLAPPANPDLQGLDLLNQAYNEAGQLKQVLLSAKIGGALQTMNQLITEKAVMQASLEAANTKWLQLDTRAKQQDAEIDKLRAELHDLRAYAASTDVVLGEMRAKYEPGEPVPDPVETPFAPPAEPEAPPAA